MVASPLNATLRASYADGRAKGTSCFPFGETLNCLCVCGISDDATTRELHILFSACPGYVASSILTDDASKRPYALVQFADASLALQASAAREGTCWEEGARPITIDLGKPVALARSASLRIHFNAGRKMRSPPGCALSPPPGSARSDSSDGSPSGPGFKDAVTSPSTTTSSRTLSRGTIPCSPTRPKVEACRARLEAALAKRRMGDLEEAVEEGISLGLSDEDLRPALEVLQKSRHRLGVRQALFAAQKAKQRLAQAWTSLEDHGSRAQSVPVALSQAKEAAELCASAVLRGDEQTLCEEAQSLARAWMQAAEGRLKAASFAAELQGLRQSVEEWEILGSVLGSTVEKAADQISEVEMREAVARIVAEEAGAKSARHGEEQSLTYVLATVSMERDGWSFNAIKWSILWQQAKSVLDVEEHRATTSRLVVEALAQNALLAELRSLEQATRGMLSKDLATKLHARCDFHEGQILSRWALFGAMVASRVSSMTACIQGPQWVKSAIKQAKGAGFGKCHLEAALDCFDRTEYQRRLHETLMDSVAAKDLVRLRAVIKEMEVVYVAEVSEHLSVFRLTMARAKLQYLDEQAAAAARLDGLLQVRRKTVLLDELPEAIENAKRLRVEGGSISRGEELLQLAGAQDLLQAAVEAGDRQAVRQALANAQGFDSFSDCSLEEKERHVQQAKLFEQLSQAVEKNRLQVARQLLQHWHEQAFDPDAVAEIEGLFARLDAVVAKAQAAIDALLQQPVAFASSTASLTAEGENMLKKLAATLQQFPQVCLRVDAYSGLANERIALELASSRAEMVKNSLRKFGLKNKLLVKSWGNSEMKKPVVRITAHGQLCVTDQLASSQKVK